MPSSSHPSQAAPRATNMRKSQAVRIGEKLRGEAKMSRLKHRFDTTNPGRKPPWIRIKLSAGNEVARVKNLLRKRNLVTVCEEASCPNLQECFGKRTATIMIMGDICTRRCPFCDVAHGHPNPLDPNEPENLAQAVAELNLRHVVITSVDRDDLLDGGSMHFAQTIKEVRSRCPSVIVEILTPDFRGRMDKAINNFKDTVPDVFNHNIETVPSLYKSLRPGASFEHSLNLLMRFKREYPQCKSKSGLMLGLGEDIDELKQTLAHLRDHDVEMLTMGQYLQPSSHHAPVVRYLHPDEFDALGKTAHDLGFTHVASGPLVRSSYFAEKQLRSDG